MNITLLYKLDSFDQQESQADLFEVFIHCCKVSNLFIFTVLSLPFLRLNGFWLISVLLIFRRNGECVFCRLVSHFATDWTDMSPFCLSVEMVLVVSIFELSQ